MPLSKRDKKVSLTKTSKKGMAMKQQLVEDIRKYVDKYDHIFVFSIHNMRNGPLKDLREEWKDSRFFFAKRKVMALALGRTEAEEMKKNIHRVASYLVGQCGLLFTNRPKDQVVQWFQDYSQMEFAKSGFTATETVILPAGPLPDFSFSLEPHLRSLGLPTQLQKGKIILREDYTVCTESARLTPEQASILKLLGKKMAEFKLKIVCVWSKDGSFEKFKVAKADGQATTGNNIDSRKGKKKSLNSVSDKKPEEEITKLFDQSSINELKIPDEKVKMQSVQMEEITITKSTEKKLKKGAVAEPEDRAVELTQTEKVEESTDNISKNKKPQRATRAKAEENMQEDSPKVMKENLRRSMRTPKPIRRTPEEKKQSVKKLTGSSKKTKSALKDTVPKTARGTPRKSVSKRIFEESEDVEMGE